MANLIHFADTRNGPIQVDKVDAERRITFTCDTPFWIRFKSEGAREFIQQELLEFESRAKKEDFHVIQIQLEKTDPDAPWISLDYEVRTKAGILDPRLDPPHGDHV